MGKNQWVSPRNVNVLFMVKEIPKIQKFLIKNQMQLSMVKRFLKNSNLNLLSKKRMDKYNQRIVLETILYLHVIKNINRI